MCLRFLRIQYLKKEIKIMNVVKEKNFTYDKIRIVFRRSIYVENGTEER